MWLASVKPLTRRQLPSDCTELAQFLIGKLVVRRWPEGEAVGRIVETEAYLPDDAACHAFRGRTTRNASLFLRPGHAYVYLAYGAAFMLNVSAEPAGIGAGVLLRAMEPIHGIEFMRRRRGTVPLRDIARGPGRLAAALGVDRTLDGVDLCAKGNLFLATDGAPAPEIGSTVRVGLTKDADRVLRFYQFGSQFVSGPRWLSP